MKLTQKFVVVVGAVLCSVSAFFFSSFLTDLSGVVTVVHADVDGDQGGCAGTGNNGVGAGGCGSGDCGGGCCSSSSSE